MILSSEGPLLQDFSQYRAQNHDKVIDNSNLFEEYIYSLPEVNFTNSNLTEKFKRLNYNMYKVEKHHWESMAKDNPEWADRKIYPKTEDIVIFVVHGNKGDREEFPILINSIEK